MTDQTHSSVLTNAPVPQPDPQSKFAVLPEGTVLTDPVSVDAALTKLQAEASAEQPLRFAGSSAAEEQPAANAPAAELKPVEDKVVIPTTPKQSFPEPRAGGAPAWAVLPPDLNFPRGRVVMFLRFKASLTNTPKKGIPAPDMVDADGNAILYRQAILWAMSVGDKKYAAGRSMGDAMRFADELVKCCIRSVDGNVVDLTGAQLDVWWDEVGEKVRSLVQRAYNNLHNLRPEDLDHFLEHCIESRSAG
jgi:hypothetical protein